MMLRALPFLLLALPLPALADETAPGRLIAVLSGDWDGDEMADAITLVQAEDGMADLVVHRGTFRGLEPVLTLPAVIFAGPMAGQAPGLEAASASSFRITTEQTGIGRTPWHAALTVAWREGGFVVAGYTYAFYDRLDLGHYGSCDVNLLTGDYEIALSPGDEQPDGSMVEGSAVEVRQTGRGPRASFALAELREGYAAPACARVFQ